MERFVDGDYAHQMRKISSDFLVAAMCVRVSVCVSTKLPIEVRALQLTRESIVPHNHEIRKSRGLSDTFHGLQRVYRYAVNGTRHQPQARRTNIFDHRQHILGVG